MELKPAISLIEKPNFDELYFISDLHIRDTSEQVFQNLINLIQKSSSKSLLVFGGDIFHVFVGNSAFFENKFKRFFEVLKSRSQAWIYLAGNHDFHHDKIIAKYGGVYYDHPVIVALGKLNFFFAHGDEVDEQDKNYAKLRNFFHSSFSRFAIQNAPGFLIENVGNFLGSLSKDSRAKKKKIINLDHKQRQIGIFRDYAKKIAILYSVDAVFLGHNHIITNEKILDGPHLLNPGRNGEWGQEGEFFIHWKHPTFLTLPLSDIL